MAKKNWSRSEANNDRKTHASKYAGTHYRQRSGAVTVTVDPAAVRAAFKATSDANHDQQYQPPIVGKSICR